MRTENLKIKMEAQKTETVSTVDNRESVKNSPTTHLCRRTFEFCGQSNGYQTVAVFSCFFFCFLFLFFICWDHLPFNLKNLSVLD